MKRFTLATLAALALLQWSASDAAAWFNFQTGGEFHLGLSAGAPYFRGGCKQGHGRRHRGDAPYYAPYGQMGAPYYGGEPLPAPAPGPMGPGKAGIGGIPAMPYAQAGYPGYYPMPVSGFGF